MSSVQEQVMTIHREEYIPWPKDWENLTSTNKDTARHKLLDTNVKCLLGLGCVPIVVGIATGIWPVALAGLGPWFLAWLDTKQRGRERKR